MNAIADSVDKVLDESHRFKGAVRAAFEKFQLPSPAKQLPIDQLLPALQYFIQVCPFLCTATQPPRGLPGMLG